MMSGMSEIAACPPSPVADDSSALPPTSALSPTSSALLQSVTFLDCSLDASPCVPATVPYYITFQGTAL